eukprot:TRINITY_DN66467_c0_g1_i1.p1 TRINITY_DN66467_c0_g1~~TRINITY_DN66467_c0_g1_i1.p1  ORF type:complete len:396 (+),score=28.74 TRINITY_DN66467_c0_g1_i1:47-1234(+)
MSPCVLVCRDRSCRNAGSEVVLLDIEALANEFGACTVRATGCLGECDRGPNAVVQSQKRRKLITRITDIRKSAVVYAHATGTRPCLDDPEVRQRITNARDQLRIRQSYAPWFLSRVTMVSKHSAIYHLTSSDSRRGSPIVKGRGRTVWHKTWHTALLVNESGDAGNPSPGVEREYTPISSARDWENGKCDLLIKFYRAGRATSWLYEQQIGAQIWLSKPAKTLDVPSLVPDLTQAAFKPGSYLLVLAGSGIVAVPQVLHHGMQETCFGGNGPVLTSPVSLIYSCRRDDVCMTSDLMCWCKEGRLRHCTLLLTESHREDGSPFPEVRDVDVSELAALDNVAVVPSRLSPEILASELRSLSAPCRIVISGPASFNAAAKDMLVQSGVDESAITLLSA